MVNNLVFHTNKKVSLIIDKKAFEDVINSLSKTIEGIKINDSKTEILIREKENNIFFLIEVKISSKLNIYFRPSKWTSRTLLPSKTPRV